MPGQKVPITLDEALGALESTINRGLDIADRVRNAFGRAEEIYNHAAGRIDQTADRIVNGRKRIGRKRSK